MKSKNYMIVFQNGIYFVTRRGLVRPEREFIDKENAIKYVQQMDERINLLQAANDRVNDELKKEGWQ